MWKEHYKSKVRLASSIQARIALAKRLTILARHEGLSGSQQYG